MQKDDRIGFRVPTALKRTLMRIAEKEDKSLAKVCEIFLSGGVFSYKEEGPKYLQDILSRQKKKPRE
jgi:hypothetical protein